MNGRLETQVGDSVPWFFSPLLKRRRDRRWISLVSDDRRMPWFLEATRHCPDSRAGRRIMDHHEWKHVQLAVDDVVEAKARPRIVMATVPHAPSSSSIDLMMMIMIPCAVSQMTRGALQEKIYNTTSLRDPTGLVPSNGTH